MIVGVEETIKEWVVDKIDSNVIRYVEEMLDPKRREEESSFINNLKVELMEVMSVIIFFSFHDVLFEIISSCLYKIPNFLCFLHYL